MTTVPSPGASNDPSISTPALEATAQAEATLVAFFRAWAAKDMTAWKAPLSGSRQKDMHLSDPTFADPDRIEFGTVVAAPDRIDPWLRCG